VLARRAANERSQPPRREAVDRWRGPVFCERVVQAGSRDLQIEMGGDACLVVDPFVFFGDRDLLARIRDALGAPDTKEPSEESD
jgi:hypothetical protein